MPIYIGDENKVLQSASCPLKSLYKINDVESLTDSILDNLTRVHTYQLVHGARHLSSFHVVNFLNINLYKKNMYAALSQITCYYYDTI